MRLFIACAALAVLTACVNAGEYERGVVQLKTGKFLIGPMSDSDEGVWLERPSGRRLIPASDIKFVAATLVQAYEHQKLELDVPTLEDHLRIGEWCLGFRMYDEAREEFSAALKLAPKRADIKRKIIAIDDTVGALIETEAALNERRPTSQHQQPDVAQGNTLGQLPRELAAQYAQRVQPLLVSRCANAGCHHANSDREFRLAKVTAGRIGDRPLAERNLVMILQHLNHESPEQSPLLAACEGPHGGQPRGVLTGPAAAAQRKLITDWVQQTTRHWQPATLRAVPANNVSSPTASEVTSPVAASPNDVALPPTGQQEPPLANLP